jgi:archaellum component FlaC
MINKLVNNILNQASFTLSDTKDRILVIAKKRAQEETITNVPSPQDFKQQLEGLALDSPNALQKAEKLYNKFRNLLEKAIQKLEGIKEELEAIKARFTSIRDNFSKLNGITNIFADPETGILTIIKKLLPTLDLVLAAQVTPTISGTVIAKITEFKKDFKDKIKNVEGVISNLNTPTEFFVDEVDQLEPFIDQGISNVQSTIDQLQFLLDQLNAIWARFNLSLPITETQDTTTGDQDTNTVLGGTTFEEYLKNPDNLRDVITKVVLPTYKVRYEIRKNGPGTELYESGIREIPIDQNI